MLFNQDSMFKSFSIKRNTDMNFDVTKYVPISKISLKKKIVEME